MIHQKAPSEQTPIVQMAHYDYSNLGRASMPALRAKFSTIVRNSRSCSGVYRRFLIGRQQFPGPCFRTGEGIETAGGLPTSIRIPIDDRTMEDIVPSRTIHGWPFA